LDGHFIFVCKPSSHPLIQEYIAGIDLQTHEETVKHGKKRSTFGGFGIDRRDAIPSAP
ncbi:MAG: hypothetical protein IT537_15370, partial [Hyphomicrobiales bacterium]|nr:hypothetical protein [Hyphomicrobiales bacterium]